MTDIGAFARHFNNRLAALEERQDGFEQDVSSLAMAIQLRPTERREAPICMVDDPDQEKYRKFSLSIDSYLAKGEIPPVRWRTLWIHLCKKAIMAGDHELLGSLIALNYILGGAQCGVGLEALVKIIES